MRIEGALDVGDGKTSVTLSRFSTESPRLLAEIALSADSAAPRVDLTARGSGLDVTALRGKLLPFAGDDPTIAAIFAIFQGGTLTSFSFAVGGKTPGDLGVFERMSIQAVLADGNVRIGSVGLDLEEARGDVAVEKGVLSAVHAAARIGRSQASDGSVRIGLAANDDTLRVEATVQSDLAELPGILSRAVRGGSFHEELSLVEDLAGSATARITIGDRAGALETKVSVSEMQLSARYRRLPWPIRIRRGTFFYDGNRVGVSRLSGNIGSSTLSGLAARVRLGDSPRFEEVSGTFELALDELFPWLASRKGMEALRTKIAGLRGSIGLSVSGLSGPISRPVGLAIRGDGILEGSRPRHVIPPRDPRGEIRGFPDRRGNDPRDGARGADGRRGPPGLRRPQRPPAGPSKGRSGGGRRDGAGGRPLDLGEGVAPRRIPSGGADRPSAGSRRARRRRHAHPGRELCLPERPSRDARRHQETERERTFATSRSPTTSPTPRSLWVFGRQSSKSASPATWPPRPWRELLATESQRHGHIEGDFHALVPRHHLGKTSAERNAEGGRPDDSHSGRGSHNRDPRRSSCGEPAHRVFLLPRSGRSSASRSREMPPSRTRGSFSIWTSPRAGSRGSTSRRSSTG